MHNHGKWVSKLPKSVVAPLKLARSVELELARSIERGVLRRSSIRIAESFPMFAPMSRGSWSIRASLTIQSAQQTFPLILELLSSTGDKIEAPTPISMLANTNAKQEAALRLKDLFDRHGSDKGDVSHGYHLLYGALLALQDASAVLEIGLGTNNVKFVSHMTSIGRPGASLRAFRDFLPGAQVYGADIDREILFSEDRITTFFVDQTDIVSFSALAASLPTEFDLIIDDGLHSPNANLATLVFGLGRLKVNGCLVVEDISSDALSIWQVVSAALLPDRYESFVIEADQAFLFLVRRLK